MTAERWNNICDRWLIVYFFLIPLFAALLDMAVFLELGDVLWVIIQCFALLLVTLFGIWTITYITAFTVIPWLKGE